MWFVVFLSALLTVIIAALPTHYPPPTAAYPMFSGYANTTIALPPFVDLYGAVPLAEGSLVWPGLPRAPPASFVVAPALVTRDEAEAMLARIQKETLDSDADSVDQKPTHEFYLERYSYRSRWVSILEKCQ